jgi:transposase
MIHDHGPQDYTQEFRRQAVDLYRSTPGTTLRGIAADLGISRHTLQVWVHALDPKGPSSQSGRTQGRRLQRAGTPEAELGALRARVAALETENAELMVEQTKLATERVILRQAAKDFAGETNW